MKVIVMNGQGGSGKSTFEQYVVDCAAKDNKVVTIYSMVTYIKECAKLLGWDGGKTDADRKFLSDLKLALESWDNSPRINVEAEINAAVEAGEDLIFIDAREAEDIEWLKETFDAIVVLVDRKLNRTYGNIADDGVMDITYDFVVENTGTLDDLRDSAKVFWELVRDDKI